MPLLWVKSMLWVIKIGAEACSYTFPSQNTEKEEERRLQVEGERVRECVGGGGGGTSL
ncbi:hypothetical protein JZ751_008842 [Albula glossodonta]|uniref:Uncharacterized protein n=1 Tax=Albula glossodonta TaxID=121402 RepID=A0A8T2P830_9TELE|nr:hypothetical protein JZ751_008842 [Albula glossodonta]